MITYENLRRDKQAFKSLTGMTVDEFDVLYAKVEAVWHAAEVKRLSRPNRQRASGGGVDYRLDLSSVWSWYCCGCVPI